MILDPTTAENRISQSLMSTRYRDLRASGFSSRSPVMHTKIASPHISASGVADHPAFAARYPHCCWLVTMTYPRYWQANAVQEFDTLQIPLSK
jgi:hypothetical protein